MKLTLVAAIAFVLQCTLATRVAIGGGGPDLLLILAVFCALSIDRASPGAVACWTIGLLKDIGSSGLLGGFALLFLVVWYAVSRVKEYIFREDIPTQFIVTFALGMGVNILYAAVASIMDVMPGFFDVVERSLVIALWTAVAAPPAILLLSGVVFRGRTATGGIRW